MRKDAQARRDKIVAVAADLFEQEGYDVPLEAIAERAGVGRGTLYRNFRDRSALILEVVKLRIAEMFAVIDAIHDPLQAFLELLFRGGILTALHSQKNVEAERDATSSDEWQTFEADLRISIQRVVDKAIASGNLRADLSSNDVILMARVLASSVEGLPADGRDATIRRAVDLLFSGLRPGPRRRSPRSLS